jgi:hypothetical protein
MVRCDRSFRNLAAALLLPALVVTSACAQQPAKVRVLTRSYGPKVELRYSRPKIAWEVWSDGGRVTAHQMRLNGKVVRALYDERQRELSFLPAEPLGPGAYRVECEVTVNGLLRARHDWEFRVGALAVLDLPSGEPTCVEAAAAVNAIRRSHGLPELSLNPMLAAASLAHSRYLSENSLTGHNQLEGTPGFFGVTHGERLEAYGYLRESLECVMSGLPDATHAVRSLFDAPYHRIAFLQPGSYEMGAGFFGERLTIAFAVSPLVETVVSPSDGQVDVPTSWKGRERPNPLRLHPVEDIPGHVLVFAVFPDEERPIEVAGASLRDASGTMVPIFLNTPRNDEHLTHAAFLIPQRPLAPGTRYEAEVVATTASGRDVSRRWSFTTGVGAH